MAYEINIGDNLSVKLSDDSILSPDNYYAYCIRQENDQTIKEKIDPENGVLKVNPGYNVVQVDGIGNYYGSLISVILAYIDPICADVKFYDNGSLYEDGELEKTYSGELIEPLTQMTLSNELIQQYISKWNYEFVDSSTKAKKKVEINEYQTYVCRYENNVNVGVASAYISSTYGNGLSEKMLTFNILPYELTIENLSSMDSRLEYVGPETSINQLIITFNGKQLEENIDYRIQDYSPIDKFNPITCYIIGYGNFSGGINYVFEVYGDLSTAKIYYASSSSIMSSSIQIPFNNNIDGKISPGKVELYDLTLISGEQYATFFYPNYDYKYPGLKEAYISGLGPCKDTSQTFQWTVIGDINESEFIDQINPAVRYEGEEIKQISQLQFYGKKLSNDTDYGITYSSYDNYFSTPGYKTIYYNGIGNYIGTKKSTYIIYTNNETLIQTVDSDYYNKIIFANGELTRNDLEISQDADSTIKSIIIGQSVTSLQKELFANCKELTLVDIRNCSPDIEISEGCFDGCEKLEKVIFPQT